MDLRKEVEYQYGKMVGSMKVNLKMIYLMEKGFLYGQMGLCIMVCGKMESSMEKVRK